MNAVEVMMYAGASVNGSVNHDVILSSRKFLKSGVLFPSLATL